MGKKEGEEIITELTIKNNKFEKVEKKEIKITLLYGFEENKINLKLEEFNVITYIFIDKPMYS